MSVWYARDFIFLFVFGIRKISLNNWNRNCGRVVRRINYFCIFIFACATMFLVPISTFFSPKRLNAPLSNELVTLEILVLLEIGLKTSSCSLPVSETSSSDKRLLDNAFPFRWRFRTLPATVVPTLLLRRIEWRVGPEANKERRSRRNLKKD